ncbi:hypothetical protein C8Q76DRAFT_758684 [Earliella scabrosa]|nr:hypothetical protein C8Q76DRAFT_758684 [Earliella scabrosa]
MSPSSSNWHCGNCPQLRIVMSSSDQQDLIDYLDSNIPYELTLLCGLALLLYDTAITFDTEVDVVWLRKINLATCLHILNRYCQIGAYTTASILLFPVSDRVRLCHSVGTSEEVFTILPYLSWALFSGVRTHALSDGSLILATLVVLLNGLYIVPDVYLYSNTKFVNSPYPYGCSQMLVTDVLWASRGAMLLGESLVLFWTLKKTVSFPLTFTSEFPISTPPAYGRTRTLAEVVRNNVLNLTTLALVIVHSEMSLITSQCIVNIRDALTTILVSRYLLELGVFGTCKVQDEQFDISDETCPMYFTSGPDASRGRASAAALPRIEPDPLWADRIQREVQGEIT